jgi:hypothetical protein
MALRYRAMGQTAVALQTPLGVDGTWPEEILETVIEG